MEQNLKKVYIEPIVGEITQNNVIFLLTPTFEVTSISLHIIKNGIVVDLRVYELISDTCNRISVSIPYDNDEEYCRSSLEKHLSENNADIENSYTFQWFINDELISSHCLNMGSVNKLIFVSCDLPEGDTKHSLWNKVSYESPDLCCHIGDNIYGDDAYDDLIETSRTEAKNTTHSYESSYHNAWSRWAPLLRNTSHIMIPDDHDITDNYDCNHDNNPATKNTFSIFPYGQRCNTAVDEGMRMYNAYQASLLNMVDMPGYVFKHLNDNTTLVMLSRTFLNNDIVETLKSIEYSLRKHVIIAVSSAPIPMPHNIAGTIYETVFGRTGWNDDKLKELYDFCFSLLEEDISRNIVLIGGDIHIGVHGKIIKNDLSIPIYVTSPISNHPTIIEYIYSKALTDDHTLFDYKLKLTAKAKRNYLKVTLPLKNDDPGEIVWSEETKPKSLIKYYRQLWRML